MSASVAQYVSIRDLYSSLPVFLRKLINMIVIEKMYKNVGLHIVIVSFYVVNTIIRIDFHVESLHLQHRPINLAAVKITI